MFSNMKVKKIYKFSTFLSWEIISSSSSFALQDYQFMHGHSEEQWNPGLTIFGIAIFPE